MAEALVARNEALEREVEQLRTALAKKTRWSPPLTFLARSIVSAPLDLLRALPRHARSVVASFMGRRHLEPAAAAANPREADLLLEGEATFPPRVAYDDDEEDEEDMEDMEEEEEEDLDDDQEELEEEDDEDDEDDEYDEDDYDEDDDDEGEEWREASERKTRVKAAIAACQQHSQALEAANAAERALLFEIAREGAAERATSLTRERERAAAASSRAAAGRVDPVRAAASAWARLADASRGTYLEVRETGAPSGWVVRVMGVATPEADALGRLRGSPASAQQVALGYHRSALSSSRRDGGGFVGAVCVEPLLDPNRLPIRADCVGGSGFERLFPRHHAWPFAPWDSDSRTPAPACRLLTLERLGGARLIEHEEEIRRISSELSEREVVVHYIVDNDEACPVKVEPSDVPLAQYHIDYEVPRRRPFASLPRAAPAPAAADEGPSRARRAVALPTQLAPRSNDEEDESYGGLWPPRPSTSQRRKTRLRVRHAATGARIRCRSRRANSLSLDPVELYTAPISNGINVLHLHVNSFGDDASVAVVDVRTTQEYADALAAGACADDATKRAVEATKRKDGLFGVDASGRALDYAILADGSEVVAVLVADDSADDDDDDDEEDDVLLAAAAAAQAQAQTTTSSSTGGPPPPPPPPPAGREDDEDDDDDDDDDEYDEGLEDDDEEDDEHPRQQQSGPRRPRPVETRFVEHQSPLPGDLVELPDGALGILRGPLPVGLLIRDDSEAAVERDEVPREPPKFRDRRCRNCGSKCPEALPGIVDVDVVSVMAPSHRIEDDPTKVVDPDALAAVLEMGFDEQRARLALAATSSPHGVPASADAAVQWLVQPHGDDAATLAALSSRPRPQTRVVMEPKLLDEFRPTSYPICAVSKASPSVVAEHAARVERNRQNSATAAKDALDKLEKLLADKSCLRDKKAALREARELKASVDDAVNDGRLDLDDAKARNINRELRLLAFG
ncbi:hypothetical protein CTAYLR_005229 [Chrysophaeum taylorii]|uniref:UBA domain-containing protein n=1 Tax=Chrysophaeum taylorii TaxID=2483200 RepID=A0AAD7XKE1_9STRA|nr:hypothetical protein CTAYLR_005229 [Chrysophaeum taylorii]